MNEDHKWKYWLSFGVSLVLYPCILGAAGFYADEKFETKPLFLLLGLFLGIALDAWELYKSVKKFS